MGVAVGLILAAFGAILTWAVDAEVSGLNVTAVGVILLIVGILVIALDLLWWRSWTWYAAGGPGRARRTYVRDTAAPVQPAQPAAPATGRRVVVDEEVGGPPAGPPP
jgi:sulfite exporter TauE/SafE